MSNGTYANWMSNPAIQALTLAELKLPGTHDSGSYSLQTALSEVQYSDIAFLWKLSPNQAPTDGKFPWSEGTFYIGPTLYAFVMNTALGISRSQDQTFLDQLNGGIRYLDLRIYYDESLKDFYVQHGLRGTTLTALIADVVTFCNNNPTATEWIILEISHTNFTTTPNGAAWCTSQVIDILGAFGKALYTPPGAAGAPDFSLQSMASLTLADITTRAGSLNPGSIAVMVINSDVDPNDPSKGYTYPTTVVNTPGFAASGRAPSGVDTVADLTQAEGGALQNNPSGTLYQVAWTLTPQIQDIVLQTQNALTGSTQTPALKGLATTANAALPGFLQANESAHYNLVTVDWYEAAATTVVELLVGLNQAAATV